MRTLLSWNRQPMQYVSSDLFNNESLSFRGIKCTGHAPEKSHIKSSLGYL